MIIRARFWYFFIVLWWGWLFLHLFKVDISLTSIQISLLSLLFFLCIFCFSNELVASLPSTVSFIIFHSIFVGLLDHSLFWFKVFNKTFNWVLMNTRIGFLLLRFVDRRFLFFLRRGRNNVLRIKRRLDLFIKVWWYLISFKNKRSLTLWN